MRTILNAEPSIFESPAASRTIRTAEIPTSGRMEQVPVGGDGSAASVSSSPSPEPAGRATPEGRDRLPATATPGSATPGSTAPGSATPAVYPVALPGGSPAAVEIPAPEPNQDGVEPSSDAGTGIVVSKRTRADHVAPSLARAYRAFLAGDASSAASAYRAVLGHEPGNRDAHLGLAAVAARAGRWNEAVGHYAQVLESHPADPVARAALIVIDERDPARAERRLSALLGREPTAAHLHFDLGNLYAAQERWPEAQQSYSRAHRLDRGHADYAYNLAVSLDHLSRPDSALGLYREALLLARSRAAGFASAAVQQRIRELQLHAETEPAPVRPPADAAVAAPDAPLR